MTGISATEARSNLYRLIDETAESHQPIVIMGKRNRAVLIAEEDWPAIQEMPSQSPGSASVAAERKKPLTMADQGLS